MARGPASTDGPWRILAALLALIALALGTIGLAQQTPGSRLPDLIYGALQLFVLGSDQLSAAGPHPVVLEIARFLAPFTTVVAVLLTLRSVLVDEVRRRLIARTTGHTIVTGDDPAALMLAANLREAGTHVVLVRSAAASRPHRGADPTVVGDAREPDTLRAAGIRRAASLYACDPHSATNAAVTRIASTLRPGTARRLTAFAQVRNDNLVEALRVRGLAGPQAPGARIGFFALDEVAARELIKKHPPEPGPPVVLGLSSLGEAVVRAVTRRQVTAGTTIVVAGEASSHVAEFAARLDAGGRGWTVRAGTDADGAGPVYVCLDDEDAALTAGLRLSRADDRRIVVCLQRADPFRGALEDDGGLRIFGVLDEACTADAIATGAGFGWAARAIHERYVADAASRGDTADTNPSMKPWNELRPHLQESNYGQAEHIGVKLEAIGASLTTVKPPQTFSFSADEIHRLARLEHVRWMEERLAAGFVYGPRRDGRHHPDLVDWSNLSEESKQKDVDAVRQLPDLLADAGMYIQRDR